MKTVRLAILCGIKKSFKLWNIYFSSSKQNHPFVLHLIQNTRHIESTIVYFISQSGHQDIKHLMTCRIGGMLHQESDDTIFERLGRTSPHLSHLFLCQSGKVVHNVQTKNKKILCQSHNFLLIDSNEVHICLGNEIVGVTLVVTKYRFKLKNIWRGNILTPRYLAVGTQ